MRLVAVLFTLASVVAGAQQAGTVLTASEIDYPHLIRRPVTVEGRGWLGLTVSDTGSRLQPFDVRWMADVEFEDSLFTLVTTPEAPLMLIADVPGISAGLVTTLSRYELGLETSEPLALTLDGTAYSVTLTGTAPDLCDAEVTLTDGTTSQVLYAPGDALYSCDEPHFSVQWAGDLDGDGRLDLVVTLSSKYSYFPRQLLLSSAAGPGEIVGVVATFDGSAA